MRPSDRLLVTFWGVFVTSKVDDAAVWPLAAAVLGVLFLLASRRESRS